MNRKGKITNRETESLLRLLGSGKKRSLEDLVVARLSKHVQPSVGLSYVPDTVRALSKHGISAVQAAILDAARAGRIELRPEGGLNRLSREDLALCPSGLQDTKLSWARIL